MSVEEVFRQQKEKLKSIEPRSCRLEESEDDEMLNQKIHLLYRFLKIVVFVVLTAMVTIGGGYGILNIERYSDKRKTHSWDDCIDNTKNRVEMENLTASEAILKTRACVVESSQIRTASLGFFYVYTLFSTVGYGGVYPHSQWGQLFSIIYAILLCPMYTAFKVEFGEFLATITLNFVKRLIKWWRNFCRQRGHVGSQTTRNHYPSDITMILILSSIFAVFVSVTSVVSMFLSEMSLFESLYMTIISVYSIGLGDKCPQSTWQTFAFILPLYLLGDTIYCYLNYYILNLYRLAVSIMITCCCCGKAANDDGEEDPENVVPYPTVSHNMMQLFETSPYESGCEKSRSLTRVLQTPRPSYERWRRNRDSHTSSSSPSQSREFMPLLNGNLSLSDTQIPSNSDSPNIPEEHPDLIEFTPNSTSSQSSSANNLDTTQMSSIEKLRTRTASLPKNRIG